MASISEVKYAFVEGEKVLTPIGTGFVVGPLSHLGCYVELDGHEVDGPQYFPFSIGPANVECNVISFR